jgi:hypothetical protein
LYKAYQFKQDIYKTGCEELSGTLAELLSVLSKQEKEINDNPPLIFEDFAEGNLDERDTIKVSFL